VPFDQSVNPYQGCEHGCIYCFARPVALVLEPGRRARLRDAHLPQARARAAARPRTGGARYQCKPINSAPIPPYQPAEREHRTTRALLEVLARAPAPGDDRSQGALILRDVDLLAALASQRLCSVAVSLTTLDDG